MVPYPGANSLAPPAFPLHGQHAESIPRTYRPDLTKQLVPRWPSQPARHARSRFGLAKRTSNAQRIGFGRTRFKSKGQVVFSSRIRAAARRKSHICPRKEIGWMRSILLITCIICSSKGARATCSATWGEASMGRNLPKKVFVVSLNYFPRCVSHNTACTGDLHCVQLAALRAPVFGA